MGRPKLTFSVRRLMVAVAVAGLALPLFRAFLLNQRYQQAAVGHRAEAAVLSLELKNLETIPVAFAPGLSSAQEARIIVNQKAWAGRIREQLEFHGRMGRMFERAASRPLSPLPPHPDRPGS